MSNPILVYDNVLCDEALDELKVSIMEQKWKIANSVGVRFAGLDSGDCFFSTEPSSECNDPHARILLDVILELDSVSIDSLVEWYANLYPSGVGHGGSFHTDDVCQITAVYFPTSIEDGGELQFTQSQVQTKANRLVLFDSSLLHKANAHNDERYRVSYAFKLNGRFL